MEIGRIRRRTRQRPNVNRDSRPVWTSARHYSVRRAVAGSTRRPKERAGGTLPIEANRHPHVCGDTKDRCVKAPVENADDDRAGAIDHEDRSDRIFVAP